MADENNKLPAAQPAPRQYTMVQAPEAVFDTANFEHMARVAGMMARSTLLPAHLRVMRYQDGQQLAPGEKPERGVAVFPDQEATAANAFLIVNQARLFGGIDPFALAQVSYFVHGRLGFEGKLVQAVLERAIGAMEFVYSGEPGTKDYAITVTAWVPNADPRRKASLTGTVAEWQTTKSDGTVLRQWRGPAGQTRMLHYRGTREWARMYAPGLALGLLDDDDLEAMRDDLRARSARLVTGPGFNPLQDEEAPAGSGPARLPAQAFAAARANGMSEREAVAVAAATAVAEAKAEAEAEAEETPHDPDTGEIQPEPAAAAGGAPEAKDEGEKPSTKRLPRGFGQKVDLACLRLVEAKDPAGLDAAWKEHAVPLIQRIADEGLPTPPIHRLESARDQRHRNFETVAKANMAAEPHKPAPAAEPIRDHIPAGQLDVKLEHLLDELAAAGSLDDVDDVLNGATWIEDAPGDVQARVDDAVAERRKAIGDALAAADPSLRQTSQAADASDFPGDAEIPPTAEQLQDTVDTWVSEMRRIKSVADLAKYNDDVITTFMKGKWGGLIPKDALDDAQHTYETRKRLLNSRA